MGSPEVSLGTVWPMHRRDRVSDQQLCPTPGTHRAIGDAWQGPHCPRTAQPRAHICCCANQPRGQRKAGQSRPDWGC